MRKSFVFQAFCGFLLAVGLAGAASGADTGTGAGTGTDNGDCSAAGALMTLPVPLNKWGQIVCTPHGQVITGRSGWIWLQPADHSLVVIPADFADAGKKGADEHSYFTKAEVTQVSGDEFDKVYATFHDGFDPNEQKPIAYRLDLTSESGKATRIYFFDYFSYGWGMMCPDNQCSRDSRFMMLDMNERPKELEPPI